MPKITDPDLLNVGVELSIDTGAKTFTLAAAGNLVAKDGVTLQALYSKLVELWTTATYNKFPFPMYAIDARSGQFQFGTDGATFNGWRPANDTTRQMLRDGGWSEFAAGGALTRQHVGAIALASGFPANSQFYYQREASGAALNFTFTDAPNEGIQVFGDAGNGNFDTRTFFKIFCREPSFTYDDAVLGDVGETGTGAFKVSLPISVQSDLKIQAVDASLIGATPYFGGSEGGNSDGAVTQGSANFQSVSHNFAAGDVGKYVCIPSGPNAGAYLIVTRLNANNVTVDRNFASTQSAITFTKNPAGITVTYYGSDQTRSIGGTGYPFRVIIDGKNATAEQIYTMAQFLLRQNGDIDAGAGVVAGKTANQLCYFVGDTLITTQGVYIDNFNANDINRITFTDQNGVARTFPFTAAGAINFNSFLVGAGGYFRAYFTDPTAGAGDAYGESGAITVEDASAVPIAGAIGAASVPFTFAYDTNAQGGRTPGQDASITVVAGRPGSAKPVVATATIGRATGISISLVAEQDRAYVNP